MKTIDEFIRRHPGLRIEVSGARRVTRASDNGEWDNWDHDRYRVRLTMEGRAFTMIYRKGIGHRGSPPQLDEVLDSLRADSWAVDEDFDEWARGFGYSTDSRRAYATWEECRKQGRRLSAFLTEPEFRLLLECEGL